MGQGQGKVKVKISGSQGHFKVGRQKIFWSILNALVIYMILRLCACVLFESRVG